MSIVYNYIWDPAYQNKDYTTGGWVRMSTSMLGGGGGGGGPVTFPTSFAVSNFPSSFAVSNFPSSFAISNWPVGAPAWESASVTVGTTSTQLAPARPGRTTVSLNNASTGGQTITLTGGATIPPGAARDIPTTAAIFGVSSAAGGVIHVVETY